MDRIVVWCRGLDWASPEYLCADGSLASLDDPKVIVFGSMDEAGKARDTGRRKDFKSGKRWTRWGTDYLDYLNKERQKWPASCGRAGECVRAGLGSSALVVRG